MKHLSLCAAAFVVSMLACATLSKIVGGAKTCASQELKTAAAQIAGEVGDVLVCDAGDDAKIPLCVADGLKDLIAKAGADGKDVVYCAVQAAGVMDAPGMKAQAAQLYVLRTQRADSWLQANGPAPGS